MIYRVLLDGYDIHTAERYMMLVDPKLELGLNDAGSLEFIMPPDHIFYNNVELFKSTIEVYEDNELIWFGRAIESDVDFFKQKSIHCEGGLSYLNDSILRPREFDTTSVRSFFNYLISQHNSQVNPDRQFRVGNVTIDDKQVYRELDYETTWDAINSMCINAEGGYIQVRRANGVNYIDWIKDLPKNEKQHIEFGMNLLDISSSFDFSDICTQVLAKGPDIKDDDNKSTGEKMTIASVNGGSDILANEASVAAYGKITKVVDFNNVETPHELKQKAQEYLTDLQFEDMVISCNAADLSYTDPDKQEKFKVGTMIRCTSRPHGIVDRDFPLTKMSLSLDTGSKQITLGTQKRPSLTEIYKNSNEAVSALSDFTGYDFGDLDIASMIDLSDYDLKFDEFDLRMDDWESKFKDSQFEQDKINGTVKSMNSYNYSHWVGTQEEFDELEDDDLAEEMVYLIIDPEPYYIVGEGRTGKGTGETSNDDEDVVPEIPAPE